MTKRNVIISWYRPTDWKITIEVDGKARTDRLRFGKGVWSTIREMIAVLGQLSPGELQELYGNEWVKYLNDNFIFIFSEKQQALFAHLEKSPYMKKYDTLFYVLDQFDDSPRQKVS